MIDTLETNPRDNISPLLQECVHLFAAMENVESHDRVSELEAAVFSHGLGVCGYEASLAALEQCYASALIIDSDFLEIDQREELVRLATRWKIPIETVNRNENLTRLGGVGCLLRYRPTTHPVRTTHVGGVRSFWSAFPRLRDRFLQSGSGLNFRA